jgi:WD40 repeat protein
MGSVKGSDDYVVALALSPDNKTLYTADGTNIRLWDTGTRRELASLPSEARRFKLSPDGRFLLAQENESFRMLDVSQSPPKEVGSYKISGNDTFAVANEGKLFAVGGYDQLIRLYDDTGKEVGQLRGHTSAIQAIAFVPNRPATIATAAADNTLRVWEVTGTNQGAFSGVREAREITKLALDKMGALTVLTFDATGKLLFTGHADGSLRVWDVSL